MEPKTPEQSREKVREFLKSNGKDPDKLMPKEPKTPETPEAGAAPSAETQKPADDQTKQREQQETERRAAEAQKAEEKTLLETDEKDLTPEQKAQKKDLIAKQDSSKVHKRINELTGTIKALKAEKNSDKERIKALENSLKQLQDAVEKKPEKAQEEVARLESERIAKYSDADKALPREKRREMSKEELENWIIEDPIASQEWIAERALRRSNERTEDLQRLKQADAEGDTKAKAEAILRGQAESRKRAEAKHPELNFTKRVNELKAQGKTQQEIETIILEENPKVRIVAEILKEDSDKYLLLENGPELLAEEMERRMGIATSPEETETEEEKEARIRNEAAEAERHRLASVESGMRSTRSVKPEPKSKESDEMYQKQLAVFQRALPDKSPEEVKARLDARLKVRREIGAA